MRIINRIICITIALLCLTASLPVGGADTSYSYLIKGKVVNSNNNPIGGATITAKAGGSVFTTATTAGDGTFSVSYYTPIGGITFTMIASYNGNSVVLLLMARAILHLTPLRFNMFRVKK